MQLAPIILFTYSRPEHTLHTLDSLAQNQFAKDSQLYIFCDGPKTFKTFEANRKVQEVIIAEKNRKRFGCVNIAISQENKGLARSIITGVSYVMEKHGECIVIEDDLILGNNFLGFMNSCLEFYKGNSSIWSISGFTYPLPSLAQYPHDVYLSYRACSHGWASWSDRWEKVDWEVKDFETIQHSWSIQRKFNRGGNDLYRMLCHQMKGERDSWAIRFCYSQFKNDMLCVYPKIPLVKNVGYDGSGTHCPKQSHQANYSIQNDGRELKPENVTLNKTLLKEFKRQYSITPLEAINWGVGKLRKIFTRIKKFFNRRGIR